MMSSGLCGCVVGMSRLRFLFPLALSFAVMPAATLYLYSVFFATYKCFYTLVTNLNTDQIPSQPCKRATFRAKNTKHRVRSLMRI